MNNTIVSVHSSSPVTQDIELTPLQPPPPYDMVPHHPTSHMTVPFTMFPAHNYTSLRDGTRIDLPFPARIFRIANIFHEHPHETSNSDSSTE